MKAFFRLLIPCLAAIVFVACGETKAPIAPEFFVVDTDMKYPEKKISIREIADIEYIKLQAENGFKIRDGRIYYLDNNYILARGVIPGDILLFDRTGKAIRAINHQGTSKEEYGNVTAVTYDPSAQEIFVSDYARSRIQVYDLKGEYKRTFNTPGRRFEIQNYNDTTLFCYDTWETLSRPISS